MHYQIEIRKTILALAAVVVGVPFSASAADINGYTAEYECRAGGPRCDVDMTPPACEQTITPATTPLNDWSAINFNNRVICIQAGDHRARGVLSLNVSGTPTARKWLRYVAAPGQTDNGAPPWAQPDNARAKVRTVEFVTASYWVVHRLAFEGNNGNGEAIRFSTWPNRDTLNRNDYNIINQVLAEHLHGAFVLVYSWHPGYTVGNTVQNSVLRTTVPDTVFEASCVEVGNSWDTHLVNNEIYDCHKTISVGSGVKDTRGLVVENNDLYISPNYYTDCNGNFQAGGPCSASEAVISAKKGGAPGHIAKWIHNRIWGGRSGDGNLIGWDSSDGGMAISISGNEVDDDSGNRGASWFLFANNIVLDSRGGIEGYWGLGVNNTLRGNLIYDMRDDRRAILISSKQNVEIYSNTVVQAPIWFVIWSSPATGGSSTNLDHRCNVVVNGGTFGGGVEAGTQIGFNAFYGSSAFTNLSPNQDIVRATAAEAQQTPFCFHRKLLTGAEQVCIPHAVPTTASPHLDRCDANLGSRTGIGVDDSQGPWTDLRGTPRSGTAAMGAIGIGDSSIQQTPHPGPNPHPIPGTVEAENFDNGGEGIAFHDLDTTNNGGAYRSTAVDVQASSGSEAGGYDVGWTRAGEWLEYTVTVATAGTYNLEVRVASEGVGGSFHIEFNGVDKTGTMSVPDTGGWQNWQTLTRTVTLSAGTQVLRIAQDSNGPVTNSLANINWLRFIAIAISSPYPGPNPAAIPGTIQAENYDQGGEGVAYHDIDAGNNGGAYRSDDVDISGTNDTGGGYDVGWSRAGEWRNYTVNVASSGDYLLEARVASNGQGGTFHVEFNGQDKTGVMTVPNTGGWENWQTISRTVTLSAGTQVMRVVLDTASAATNSIGDLNYIRLTPVTYISDLPYTAITNGYGPVEKDTSNGENLANDGNPIRLNGVTYTKGLGVHAVSEVRVPLNGAYTRFISDIGIDDEMDGTSGTAQFEVWADGTLLYQSPDMTTTSSTITVDVDVTGRQELRLIVNEGSVGCCDHADWAGARMQ